MTIEFNKNGYAVTAGDVSIFNAAPDSGEFIAASNEFIHAGQGLPAHAYLDAPPKAKKGFTICRSKDELQWEYKVDHRGEVRYSTITGEKITVTALGEYPPDTTDSAPKKFNQWDGRQWVINDNLLAATARMYRDSFIHATDPLMVSDYSIDDMPLTEAQRSELTIIRAAYRAWPTVAGWPLVEMPELPQWLLIEAVNQGYRVPAWPELSDVA
ncbi:phage tail protein [Yersinia sp. Marseille-Q3913]|uniref:phage tail protein n=1 Tax=Yersinia sp. Marseille-Q3913 TaxID=2830769 RepID=UPI001BB026F1|nr:phage tail protein [Yersinia sp. Marseille-Q3913]MBS0054249.1 phage tail protein [Yersinia sp. Marseille-Q3913]